MAHDEHLNHRRRGRWRALEGDSGMLAYAGRMKAAGMEWRRGIA